MHGLTPNMFWLYQIAAKASGNDSLSTGRHSQWWLPHYAFKFVTVIAASIKHGVRSEQVTKREVCLSNKPSGSQMPLG